MNQFSYNPRWIRGRFFQSSGRRIKFQGVYCSLSDVRLEDWTLVFHSAVGVIAMSITTALELLWNQFDCYTYSAQHEHYLVFEIIHFNVYCLATGPNVNRYLVIWPIYKASFQMFILGKIAYTSKLLEDLKKKKNTKKTLCTTLQYRHHINILACTSSIDKTVSFGVSF